MYGGNRSGGFRPRDGGMGAPMAPVRVGEELDVKIEAVGEKGDGIAKKNGFVLFVPGVKEGQELRIRVTKVLRKVGFAEVVGKDAKAEQSSDGSSEEPVDNAPESTPSGDSGGDEPSEDSEEFGEESKEGSEE
ncbi:MAG TPA: TRAM domain-containing protein [Candidatus Nanoarchaeia archaeon]|nr:TRAM domain-containing protein [Candidatus Nanoarchaeia archaeon]